MSESTSLPFITLPATTTHSATVVLVHGLGDSGYGVKPLASELQAAGLGHCKFILPHAPARAITANRGRAMPAWFDVRSFTPPAADDYTDMLASLASLEQLIANEAGVDMDRVVVGGFSQGGAMSLLTGLVSEQPIHGVFVLSGRLPLRDADLNNPKLTELTKPHSAALPIFWGHGSADPLITLEMAQKGVDHLTEITGIPFAADGDDIMRGLSFKVYEGMDHSVWPQETADLAAWLQRVLPPI
ncbi:hypothetical protein MKEN_00769700 [Mycena kentingensis (nom. inval.)]|nr:hypothetical protein MKEN_00769700 [Mycena kentingensis (nom. inval.)]